MKINLKEVKTNKRVLILSIVFGAIVIFIWGNSFQDKSISDSFSNGIIDNILKFFLPKKIINHPEFHFYVRKAAHIVEFFSLGCIIGFLKIYLENRFHITLGLFVLLAIGVIDETIQNFSGRNSNVIDIIIDFMAAIAGLLFIIGGRIVLLKFKEKIKAKNKLQDVPEKTENIDS